MATHTQSVSALTLLERVTTNPTLLFGSVENVFKMIQKSLFCIEGDIARTDEDAPTSCPLSTIMGLSSLRHACVSSASAKHAICNQKACLFQRTLQSWLNRLSKALLAADQRSAALREFLAKVKPKPSDHRGTAQIVVFAQYDRT